MALIFPRTLKWAYAPAQQVNHRHPQQQHGSSTSLATLPNATQGQNQVKTHRPQLLKQPNLVFFQSSPYSIVGAQKRDILKLSWHPISQKKNIGRIKPHLQSATIKVFAANNSFRSGKQEYSNAYREKRILIKRVKSFKRVPINLVPSAMVNWPNWSLNLYESVYYESLSIFLFYSKQYRCNSKRIEILTFK